MIVGAGLAGATAAETLRDGRLRRPLVLVGDEPHRPTSGRRCPRATCCGNGRAREASSSTRRLVRRARRRAAAGHQRRPSIDRDARDGDARGRRAAAATTGCCWPPAPRRAACTCPGADLDGVHYLRTRGGQRRDCATPSPAGRAVVVIGGGWIGLETAAAAARQAGMRRHRPGDGRAAAAAGARPRGRPGLRRPAPRARVDLRSGVAVARARAARTARVTGVRLRRRRPTRRRPTLVLVGVGITPNAELAEQAGLDVDNGIVVDEHLRTADPDVFAAGDVANAYHPLLRPARPRRALGQRPATSGAVAAESMLGQDSALRPAAVLLHRPVRPRAWSTPATSTRRAAYDQVVFRGDLGGARVHRLLARATAGCSPA